MKVLKMAQARASLAEYAEKLGDEPLVITRRGWPVAALVSMDNANMETVSLGTNPKFLALIERSRRRQALKGGLSSEEMRQPLTRRGRRRKTD